MILIGHPTGNPNSHHAALAHLEAGQLAAFVVPWMPTPLALQMLGAVPGLGGTARRLERRSFEPLRQAPLVQGRLGEWRRLLTRLISAGVDSEALAYEANDWLMGVMTDAVARPDVTVVHAYEDCALQQFERAAALGKARVYDMPTCYYPAWEETERRLVRTYEAWIPAGAARGNRHVRPAQKAREMALADLVLVPTAFVARTIAQHVDRPTHLAPYGVDLDFWTPPASRPNDGTLRLLYAGQASIRKGTPLLLDAWAKAGLRRATLTIAGAWQMADARRRDLPSGVEFIGPRSRAELRTAYHTADVFVFPSFSEGFGLVLLEAMACGLPAIATDATAGPEVIDETCGRIMQAGDVDALVAHLRWFHSHQDALPAMRQAARAAAERSTWDRYRRAVSAGLSAYR